MLNELMKFKKGICSFKKTDKILWPEYINMFVADLLSFVEIYLFCIFFVSL